MRMRAWEWGSANLGPRIALKMATGGGRLDFAAIWTDNVCMEASTAPRPHRLAPPPRLLGLAGDDRLVALIRAGNERAFETVYERYHRPLLSFSRHMLSNSDDAAEAVQQTFLSAYRDLTTSEKSIQLKPWLFTIARNRCLSILRTRREHADVDAVEPATDGLAAEVQRREDLRELLGDLSRLPEDQRAALVLAELGSLAHSEIGDIVGCSREKVKALVFQARSSLAASRQARAASCSDIREQLATLRGGALRRSTLRRHLRDCAGCRAFDQEVHRQRSAFALLLPVAPVAGLKEAVLSGAGIAGGGGAAAAAGGGAAAGLSALGTNSLAVKALVAAAILGGGTAGGVIVAGNSGGGSHVARGAEAPTVSSGKVAGTQLSSLAAQGASAATAAQSVGSASRGGRRGAARGNARHGSHQRAGGAGAGGAERSSSQPGEAPSSRTSTPSSTPSARPAPSVLPTPPQRGGSDGDDDGRGHGNGGGNGRGHEIGTRRGHEEGHGRGNDGRG